MVGMGPEKKMDFPQLLRRLKRRLKLALAVTEWRSLADVWTITLFMDVGREDIISWTIATSLAVVKPGKQYTSAFATRTRLTVESPMMAVDGEGDEGARTVEGSEGSTGGGFVLGMLL